MLARRRRQPRGRFSWRTLAFEVFVVVLGVTLALGANEFREHLLHRKNVRVATESLAREMEQNCERLERAETYHRRLISEIDSLSQADPAFSGDRIFDRVSAVPSWNGYNPAFVTGSAYETARAMGSLELMPYERALGLGNYYTFVDLYQETVRNALNVVIANTEISVQQVATAVRLTLELERELGPQSCTAAAQLRGESPAARDTVAALP